MRKIIAFLLAGVLAGCDHHGVPHDPPDLTHYVAPAYEAELKGKDLACCIVRDILHTPPQPLQPGQGKPADKASWNDANGALQMLLEDRGSMGVFSTGLDFDRGRIFSVSATFRNPKVVGATIAKNWAVAVVFRTGDKDDLDDLGRIQATMRVRPAPELPLSENINEVELRVQEGLNAEGTDKIGDAGKILSGPVHDDIFSSGDPFTLTLYVDRATGRGAAILTTKTQTVELEFDQKRFSDDDGDKLTVAGATLVNQADGRTASVEITHFEIWKY